MKQQSLPEIGRTVRITQPHSSDLGHRFHVTEHLTGVGGGAYAWVGKFVDGPTERSDSEFHAVMWEYADGQGVPAVSPAVLERIAVALESISQNMDWIARMMQQRQ